MLKHTACRFYIATVLVALIGLGGLLTIPGCDSCPSRRGTCPDKLLNSSQYILTGNVIATDTLTFLGAIGFSGARDSYRVLQYTFADVQMIKGSVQTDTVHFWYLARKDMQTRHNTTIPFQSGERALVYGNRIADETRIVELLKPELSSRLEHLDSLFSGTTSEHRTRNIVDDSAVYASVASSTQLKTHFGIASSSGVVICGTERGMQTARSFLRDTLSFCCSQDQWSATTVSADEYIEILKERAKEMEQ